MDAKIPVSPALTPHPIACHCCGKIGPALWVDDRDPDGRVICSTCDGIRDRFSWDDVDSLLTGASMIHSEFQTRRNPDPPEATALRALADRIQALLPPRKP